MYSEKNKKVPGLMKDEAGGKIIEEFVGLRAKLYSYKIFEGKEEKKCKGVKKKGKKISPMKIIKNVYSVKNPK